MRIRRHYLWLVFFLALGAVLRFALLDSKPLWLDEIITALFSLGRSFNDIPLDKVFSLEQLAAIFTPNPQASCGQIAQAIATQSTHPPLFFCSLHGWLQWVGAPSDFHDLAWKLRAMPALFGVGAIAAIYGLGRVAFSPATGLAAAAIMAVSPFATYLSQEARHYTLPLFLIALALWALIKIQIDLDKKQRVRRSLWLSWVAVNTLGLYIHYFFLLALVAQIVALLAGQVCRLAGDNLADVADELPGNSTEISLYTVGCAVRTLSKVFKYRVGCALRTPHRALWLLLPFILFLPWMPVLLQHFSRRETEWFKPFEPSWTDNIVPIYQTIIGWLLMVVALPVENQPLWMAVPGALLMLGFAVWLIWQLGRGSGDGEKARQASNIAIPPTPLGKGGLNADNIAIAPTPPGKGDNILKPPFLRGVGGDPNYESQKANRARAALAIFTAVVLLEFLVIVYVLGKDITSAVRYHFIYYPSICVLLADRLAWHSGARVTASDRGFTKKLFMPVNRALAIVFLAGLASSIFVASGLVFQKPYQPERVARDMNLEQGAPLMVVVGYDSFQEVALGLSFALEMRSLRPEGESRPGTTWVFWERSRGYQEIWQNLAQMLPLPETPLSLWVVAPGLRQRDYAPELLLSGQTRCSLDKGEHYRIGIPYQLYRCLPVSIN